VSGLTASSETRLNVGAPIVGVSINCVPFGIQGVQSGVEVIAVPPAYTSQTCHQCLHLGLRSGKVFKCGNCSWHGDADLNGAINILYLGVASLPERAVLGFFGQVKRECESPLPLGVSLHLIAFDTLMRLNWSGCFSAMLRCRRGSRRHFFQRKSKNWRFSFSVFQIMLNLCLVTCSTYGFIPIHRF